MILSPIALILPITFWLVLCVTCGFAWWRGGPPERLAALWLVAASALSVLVKPETMQAYLHIEIGTFLVDLVLLGLLVGLALTTARNWALWTAGFHLAAVATHIAILLSDIVVPPAYALLQGFWGYPVLISLALGARGHWHRQRGAWHERPAIT